MGRQAAGQLGPCVPLSPRPDSSLLLRGARADALARPPARSHHRPGRTRLRPRGRPQVVREVKSAQLPGLAGTTTSRHCRREGGCRLICCFLSSRRTSERDEEREPRKWTCSRRGSTERTTGRLRISRRRRRVQGNGEDRGRGSRDVDLRRDEEEDRQLQLARRRGDECERERKTERDEVRTFLRSSHSKTSPVTGSTSLPSGCCDARRTSPCERRARRSASQLEVLAR